MFSDEAFPEQDLTHEAVCDGEQTETVRDPITLPALSVYQLCEDELRGAPARQEDERHDQGEEEDDMADTAHQLDCWK
jgi:hypothetical protein